MARGNIKNFGAKRAPAFAKKAKRGSMPTTTYLKPGKQKH